MSNQPHAPTSDVVEIIEKYIADPARQHMRLAILTSLYQSWDSGRPWPGEPAPEGPWSIELGFASRDALRRIVANRTDVLPPDQREIESDCRDLFHTLATRFPSAAIVTLGRRGGKTRIYIKGFLEGPFFALLADSRFSLEKPEPDSAESTHKPTPGKPLTADGVKAALSRRLADLKGFHIGRLDLVGSAAQDEAGSDSDLDFLVTFESPTRSDDYFGLLFFLEDLFGRRVDLISSSAIPPRRLEQLKRDAVNVA